MGSDLVKGRWLFIEDAKEKVASSWPGRYASEAGNKWKAICYFRKMAGVGRGIMKRKRNPRLYGSCSAADTPRTRSWHCTFRGEWPALFPQLGLEHRGERGANLSFPCVRYMQIQILEWIGLSNVFANIVTFVPQRHAPVLNCSISWTGLRLSGAPHVELISLWAIPSIVRFAAQRAAAISSRHFISGYFRAFLNLAGPSHLHPLPYISTKNQLEMRGAATYKFWHVSCE
jgi:hypothetical protein